MKTFKHIVGWFIIGMIMISCGCAAPGQPTATVTHGQGASVEQAQMARYDGPKARVAVGDFQVKASGATNQIGDGLREMLLTALFNCNRFIVLERQAVQDVILEQDLGASGRVKRNTASPIGQLEGADILVYGVVTEFKMGASGGGLSFGMSSIPLTFGGGVSNAHMAIDLRAVDTSTGRILYATRVEGKASDYHTRLGTTIGGGSARMPVALGSYNNTPMEKAIRVTIDTAVYHLMTKTPTQYFRFR